MHRTEERFSSRLALILVSLGMAVGVGNVWRFPRIMAKFEGGGGTFLIPWALFLFTWSIPLLVVEGAIGRRTRRGTVASLGALFGPRCAWIGAFVALCTTLIYGYYAVVAGWCMLYVVESLRGDVARMDVEAATAHFVETAQGGGAAAAMLLAFLVAGLAVARGVRHGIELANKLLLPILFVMLGVLAVFGLRQPGAGAGIEWMLTVDWPALGTPRPWLEALSQSAWSTGAGLGLILVFSTSAPTTERIVADGVITGVGNNAASLVAALATIPAVFALAALAAPDAGPVEVLGHRGPAGTGLAMVWLPRLFAQVGGAGPWFAALFFAVLTFASITSLIALLELPTRTLIDLGLSRRRAVGVAIALGIVIGLPSALSLDVFTNQDWVWSVGLVLSGLLMALAAGRVGYRRFREAWVLGGRHVPLARGLDLLLAVAIPVQFVVLVSWWFFEAIASAGGPEDPWSARLLAALDPRVESVGTCLLQWSAAFVLLYLLRRPIAGCALETELPADPPPDGRPR